MRLKDCLPPEKLAEMVNPPKRHSFAEIGTRFNVSRQRVHQLYREYRRVHPGLFRDPVMPTPFQIQELLDANISLAKIAKKFSLTAGRLKKCMADYGLKKGFIKDTLTSDRLRHLYIDLEKSDVQIARMHNCSPNTIMKLRYLHGIYESERRPLGAKLTAEVFSELYEREDLRLDQIAALFNTNIQAVINLKRLYRSSKPRAKGATTERLKQLRQSLIERGVIVQ